MSEMKVNIREARSNDAGVILELIKALAEFEKLSHEVVATEEKIRATLFGETPAARVLIAELQTESGVTNAGFALYFTTYSTFLAKPGLYLEDLFVRPEHRSHGIGQKLLAELAQRTLDLNGGRLEWSVLNWNKRAWEFYARLGAKPMEEWTVHRLTGSALEKLAKETN